MKAVVFPGQGSQVKGMGSDLFDSYPELIAKADNILNFSIKELCLNDPRNELTLTQFTQPALYVVCCLSYMNRFSKNNERPDYVSGHSIGEYSALFAAEVFDFETGLKMVKYRGKLMSEAQGGGMAAVIGLNKEQVMKVLNDNGLTSIDIANYNSLSQIVISGKKSEIESSGPLFEKAGAMMYVVLKVSGAFHSRYMADACEKFKSYLEQFEFSEPKIPVIANVDFKPYTKNNVKDNLGKQIVCSVQWVETIKYMQSMGVDQFEEIGPGKVLAGLIQRIQRGS
jgi:trans-AT polyketide synthase, acyltransferase and oxidoreductase domains